MATVNYPASLPSFEGQPTETFQDTVIRTDMSQGPAKVRRRYSATSSFLNGRMTMNEQEYIAFQAFYNTELFGGVQEFRMHDPTSGTMQTFRFMSTPEIRHLTGRGNVTTLYKLTVSLERLP